jgi:aminocarboxymuconate-semialdehyde decarboxylase
VPDVSDAPAAATAWYDVHCHFAPPEFPALAAEALGTELAIIPGEDEQPDVLVRYGRRIEFLPGELSRMVDLEQRISHMDAVGAQVQVISPPTFFAFYDKPSEVAARLARLMNEALMSATERYPDRLLMLATVPLQDAERAVGELEEALRNPAARGVIIGSSIGGRQLDDPAFEPFFEAAEALGAAIFVHPASTDLAGAERMQEYFLHNLIGNPTNTTLAAARLIFGGVLTRHPRLRVCLAHAGGYLAWALGRLTHGFHTHAECRIATDEPPAEQARRLYVDTIAHEPRSMEYVRATFGPTRLLAGSDYPFRIGQSDPHPGVEDPSLLMANARAFLGLDPGDGART